MVKVYGKRSSSLVCQFSQPNDSEVELSDTEDGKQEDDQRDCATEVTDSTSGGQDELALSNDTTVETSKLSCDSEDQFSISSVPSSVQGTHNEDKFKAFDFLDSNTNTKKRRTNYRRNNSEVCDIPATGFPSIPIDRTVSDLNAFLSSLQPANGEDDLQETLERELRKSVQESKSKVRGRVMYDRSRTMLYNKEEEENAIEEGEEKEDTTEISEEDPSSADGSTHHYNELKNMGESLKYQDDLGFLTEKSPSKLDTDSFTSRLLNLALTLKQDEDFLLYVDKHCAIDVCSWSLAKKALDHPVTTMLQVFLLAKIDLPQESLPFLSEKLIVALLSADKVPPKSALHSKMTRLNFIDFLKRTDHTTGQVYALELCLKYRNILKSEDISRRVIRLIEENKNPQLRVLLHPLADCILTQDTTILQDFTQGSSLLSNLVAALPQECNDEFLIKSLILLSNEHKIITQASKDDKTKIMNCSLDFVLDNVRAEKSDNLDMVILHLGLILNLVDACDWQIDASRLELARDMLYKNMNTGNTEFMVFMLSLALTHLLHRSGVLLPRDEKNLLTKILKPFDSEAKNCNESIRIKVTTALNYLL